MQNISSDIVASNGIFIRFQHRRGEIISVIGCGRLEALSRPETGRSLGLVNRLTTAYLRVHVSWASSKVYFSNVYPGAMINFQWSGTETNGSQ